MRSPRERTKYKAASLMSVKLFANMSNVPPHNLFLQWPPRPPFSNIVKDLGNASSAAQCQKLCASFVNVGVSNVSGWSLCQSFTWSENRCIGIVDQSAWTPMYSAGAVTGRFLWSPTPCKVDADCSYNGRCQKRRGGKGGTGSDMHCNCDAAWAGDRCQTLALLPTTRTAGLRSRDDGANTSSWGGAVLLDNSTGLLHMWASEMKAHCGISTWTTNSHIVHAVSTTPHGNEFERKDEIWPAFSHEPKVIRGAEGEWVMYYTAIDGAKPGALCQACSGGSTTKDSHCSPSLQGTKATFMSVASSPSGPWSRPARLFANHTNVDTNLAMVILANGSAIGLARTAVDAPLVIAMHPVTAKDWRDPTSYIGHWNTTLFPDLAWGPEDPMLYVDESGIFHAVFHNQLAHDDERLCGGHAFSEDGLKWTFTGTAWGNSVEFVGRSDNSTRDAQNSTERYEFSRRERPHIVFGDPSSPFKITALTTGVQFGPSAPISVLGEDSCYTLWQPVKQ